MVFLASLGTGVITNGIFFVAKQGAGFGPGLNFALGLMLGVTYIAGAVGIGPALRRVAARRPEVSSRAVMAALSVLMGLCALLPATAAMTRPEWAAPVVWISVAIYAPCSGAFWPIVESYLSGGRSGARLRRAVGQFNVVWALAVLVALWAMGPLLESAPLVVLIGFGAVQLLATALVIPMGAEPGKHIEEEHEPHPPVYLPLLTTFRLLLPTSYFVVGVWSPYAPEALDRLGVPLAWQTTVAATWMLSRFVVFGLMGRWAAWQGRWWPVVASVVGMVGGIGVALIAPRIGGTTGIALVLAGLGALGVANGIIYTASLYYAMEVGRGEVEAGGTHEALIGVGFAGGPATGLLAVGLVTSGMTPGIDLNGTMLALLGIVLALVGLGVTARVLASVRRSERLDSV
jgi:MFS family permease